MVTAPSTTLHPIRWSMRDMLARSIAFGLPCLPALALLYAFAHRLLQGRGWNPFTANSMDVGWPVAIFVVALMVLYLVASLFLFAQCVRHLGMVLHVLVRRGSGNPYRIFCNAEATEFLDSDGRHYRFDRHGPGILCPLGTRDGSGWIIFHTFDSPSGLKVQRMSRLFALALSVSAFRLISRTAFYVPISGGFDERGIIATYAWLLTTRHATSGR